MEEKSLQAILRQLNNKWRHIIKLSSDTPKENSTTPLSHQPPNFLPPHHPISSPPRSDAEDGIKNRKGAMLTPLTMANSDKQINMLTTLTATSSRGGPQAEEGGGKLCLKAYL